MLLEIIAERLDGLGRALEGFGDLGDPLVVGPLDHLPQLLVRDGEEVLFLVRLRLARVLGAPRERCSVSHG
ncbi:hypothetical protein M1P56_03290 [Streptomyces sp. HU2014]|nr:hypothetical protein M1P56_03290 [Streptomyces sp. HU2014]